MKQQPSYCATIAACLVLAAAGLVHAADQQNGRAGADANANERLFAAKVWPLLAARCLPCHGGDPQKLEGGLNLSDAVAARKGGDSGMPAFVAGKPADSLLYIAVTRDSDDLAMPPKENDALSDAEVEAIRTWIAGGAAWPAADRLQQLAQSGWNDSEGVSVATSGGLSPEWTSRKYKPENLWAYQPLAKPPVPLDEAAAPANPIDAFLAAGLRQLGLEPAPRVDRQTLIRRATFDLIGLPPAPEDVASFVNDPDPDQRAFAKVVNRLLGSSHYGEQWGRHWLDVARYADSAGFANDYERGNAWRYRDYVVRAFNEDKPYDVFVREQLAGDEIDPGDPELLVAVGFLRMGPWELTGMEVAKVARQKFLDDVTETVGQVFLAHPLQCAKCHDHKFDPIPTRDYYRIQAAFATTQLTERQAAFLADENREHFDERRYLEARKARYEAALAELDAKQEAAARKWCAQRGLEYTPRARGLREGIPEDKLPPARIGLDTRDLGMERIARKGLERLRWEFDRYEPVALSVYSGRTPELRTVQAPMRMPPGSSDQGELETTCILAGGDPFSPGEEVTPGALSIVSDARLSTIPQSISGRRLALAEWIASPANPLTPRVMVNRIWQWHFGQAIAGNANNFGAMGKKPTHPALLDWLAAEFIESGWSVKAMHRLIMNSEAYSRSARHTDPAAVAVKDPAGTSYAVFHPRRLAAEELRDAMLAVSGELNGEIGGLPVRPELDPEVALQPRQVMGTFAPAWQPSPRPEQRHRRSIYSLKLRGLRDPFLEVFNQPSPDASCECRDASTVTPQVFSLFSSEATMARALAFAARLLEETESRPAAIDRAFQLAYGRPPTDVQRQACLRHWEQMALRHRQLVFQRSPLPREVIREAVEENTGEKFTFTEVLDSADDFVPDPHPADAAPELRGLMEVCLVLLNASEFVYVD